jgi:hypothetical protein
MGGLALRLWESAVGIVTGYILDSQRVGVQVLVGAGFFSFPCCPGPHPSSHPVGTRGSFPSNKVAGT